MQEPELRLVHDLRNTAAVIRTAAQELEDADLPPEVGQRLTRMITRRSEMLLRLLDDLAPVSPLPGQRLTVDLQPVALDRLLQEALPRRWTAHTVSLTVEVAPDAVALTDPTRLTQVVDNLVSNAVRYGGPRIAVRGHRQGPWVHLQVEDDGPGVPPEIAPHIFDPYVRGPRSAGLGGQGLGLTIVRVLCDLLGGTVTYAAGDRPHFEVRLPAAPAAAQPTPSSSRMGSIAK